MISNQSTPNSHQRTSIIAIQITPNYTKPYQITPSWPEQGWNKSQWMNTYQIIAKSHHKTSIIVKNTNHTKSHHTISCCASATFIHNLYALHVTLCYNTPFGIVDTKLLLFSFGSVMELTLLDDTWRSSFI